MYKCLFVNVGSDLEQHVRAILALNVFHFLFLLSFFVHFGLTHLGARARVGQWAG